MNSKKFCFYGIFKFVKFYLVLLFLIFLNKEGVKDDELLLLKLSIFVNGVWGVNSEELFES